ncbi:MAG: isochorismate synthase, partial [Solirubrobacteraceae bacterium]
MAAVCATREFGWLDAAAASRLERRLATALSSARRSGESRLVSVSCAVAEGSLDPSAAVAAARTPRDSWFCFEQPDRDGSAVAALGQALTLEASGPERFQALAKRWRKVAGAALADDPVGQAGAGLVAIGGFAFDPQGGASRTWSGFAPASLIVPELSLARRHGTGWLTVNVAVCADD